MKAFKKILGLAALVVGSAIVSKADDPAAAIVTAAQGITTTSTTTYVAAAGLGIAMLTVGMVVYALRRGTKTR